MMLMALATGLAVAGVKQIISEIIPIFRVRVHLQAGSSAVALQANIPFRVTGLAGRQILARLAGMLVRPLVSRENRIGMASLALLNTEIRVRSAQRSLGEAFAVRGGRQVGRGEILVALDAEFVFMAA